MRNSLRAAVAASPFAHLLGPAPRAAAEREEERDESARAEEREEEEEHEEDEREERRSKRSKKANSERERAEDEEEEEEASEEEEDEDEGERRGKKAKKAKADEEDGDEDYDAGKKAERQRWAKVLKSPAAGGGRLPAACEMLTNTSMSGSAIIRTLSALPAGEAAASGGLRRRMAEGPRHSVGPGTGGQSGPQSFADEMAAAVAQVRPAPAR